MKIYTKTGDAGTTSLIGGERVSKADPRVEAYGTVDELAAHLALLSDMMCPTGHFEWVIAAIGEIQKDLMTVEALLATGRGGRNNSSTEPRMSATGRRGKGEVDNSDGGSGCAESKVPPLPVEAILRLESQIDEMGAELPPLKGFTIPGGHPVVSQCHICRTVCRRAERAVVGMSEQYPAAPGTAEYLNRLSDWLYVAGRKAVEVLDVKESYWAP